VRQCSTRFEKSTWLLLIVASRASEVGQGLEQPGPIIYVTVLPDSDSDQPERATRPNGRESRSESSPVANGASSCAPSASVQKQESLGSLHPLAWPGIHQSLSVAWAHYDTVRLCHGGKDRHRTMMVLSWAHTPGDHDAANSSGNRVYFKFDVFFVDSKPIDAIRAY
jgi:hypothetical protein